MGALLIPQAITSRSIRALTRTPKQFNSHRNRPRYSVAGSSTTDSTRRADAFMSAIRRSPAIPLSPSSPPESGLKQRPKRRLSEDAPNSPATPPLMSIAVKSYGQSNENAHSAADQTSQTSPASSSSSAAFTQQSTQFGKHSILTPASSAFDGSRVSMTDDQHRDKRLKMDNEGESAEGRNSILPTNHDRQPKDDQMSLSRETFEHVEAAAMETKPAGEERALVEDKSIEKLRKDTGDAFVLCKSTISRSRVDPKTHLLSRFGLGPLLAKVTRTDPVTGEKINKLRKSYEGQVKMFELAGRNKVVKSEALENGKRPLRSMVEDISEADWDEKHNRIPLEVTPDLRVKLQKALQMQPGPVRNNSIWEERLGHEKSRPGVAVSNGPVNTIPYITGTVRQPNGISRPQVPAAPGAVRPRRTNKKRSYADDSFEGYGEGFGDDDGELDDGAFDDEDEGGGGSARKKRKKEHAFSVSPISYAGGYRHGL